MRTEIHLSLCSSRRESSTDRDNPRTSGQINQDVRVGPRSPKLVQSHLPGELEIVREKSHRQWDLHFVGAENHTIHKGTRPDGMSGMRVRARGLEATGA